MKKLIYLIVIFFVPGIFAQTNNGWIGTIDYLPPNSTKLNSSNELSVQNTVSSINLTGNFNDLVIVVGFSDKDHNYPIIENNNNYPLWGAFPDSTLLRDSVTQHGPIPADEWYQPAFNYYYTELSGGLYNVSFNFVKSSSNSGTYLSNHPFSYWESQNGGSDLGVIDGEYSYILRGIADQLHNENPNIFNNVACMHFVFLGVTPCEFYHDNITGKCAGGTIKDNVSLISVDGSTTYWTGPITIQRNEGNNVLLGNIILHERLHIIGEISNYPPTGDPSTGFRGFPDRGMNAPYSQPLENNYNNNAAYDIMYHAGDNLPPLHSIYGEIPLTSQDLIFLGWIKQDEIEPINSSNYTNYSDIKIADWSSPLTTTQINEGYRRIVKVMIHENYDGLGHDEYFLIEYHNASGLDKAFENYAEYPLTGYNKGVLIWHIKEKTNMINRYSDNIMRLVAAVPYNGSYGNPIPADPYRTNYSRSPGYNGINSGEFDYMDDALMNPSTNKYLHMQDGGEHIWETTVVNDLSNTYGWDPTGLRLFWRLESLSSDFFSNQSIKGHVTDEITDATRPSTKDWGGVYSDPYNPVPSLKTHIAISNITNHGNYATVRVYYNYYIVDSDSTIPSGTNVTIAPNSHYVFNNGASLTVNGTLNIGASSSLTFNGGGSLQVNGNISANGTPYNRITFDFVSGTSPSNGIYIQQWSQKTFSYCNIKNAGNGIYCYNGGLTLDHCNITNCYYGIDLEYSGGTISNDIIDSSYYDGIRLYNSSPEIYGNIIGYTYFEDGIHCLAYCNPNIHDNLIWYNYGGIYLYYSIGVIVNNQIFDSKNDGIYGESPNTTSIIKNNSITKDNTPGYYYHSGIGIYLTNHSNNYITHNNVQGFDYGIYRGGGGYSYFTDENHYTPSINNRFIDDYISVCAAWGNTIIAGGNDSYTGGNNNTFDGNYMDARAYQNGTLYAESNYWGTDGIQTTTEDNGQIFSSNPLSYDPWGGENLLAQTSQDVASNNLQPSVIIDTATGNDISTGIALEEQGKTDKAVQHYKEMISKDSYPYFALSSLAKIQAKFSNLGIDNYFTDLIKTNSKYKTEVQSILASFALADTSGAGFDKAMNLYDDIISESKDSYQGINAQFEKFFAYLNFKNDRGNAGKILTGLKNMKLDDDELKMRLSIAENMFDPQSQRSNLYKQNGNKENKELEDNNTPKEYGLSNNYPNPFNPATTINYQLPNDGYVTLKVYDVLGNVVKTLVDGHKNAGRYSVIFNAGNLASGIYLYRLAVTDYSGKTKGFVSTKKMLLIK